MKWLRIILPIFLIMGMIVGLFCVSSVAYADDGDEEEDGLDVDITVVGDDAEVGVDVLGDDSEVTVNTSGTEVWINGRNLNEPVAVYNVLGVDGGYVNRKINEALAPFQSWISEYGGKVELTAVGLAKLIWLVQEQDSEISTLAETLDVRGHVASLRESASEQRMSTLESQQAQIQARVNYLRDYYNRTLLIIIGAFSLAVIGLAIALFLTRRRLSYWTRWS